jgi:photosystem II stability/assembly factor-like uncharacterized protein
MKLRRGSFILAALMAFLILFGSPSLAASRWKELDSSYPSSKALVQIHMTSLSTGCAAGYDATFWRTTDGGNNWTLVQGEDPNHNVTRMRFLPTDPNVGYAAASNGLIATPSYIYKTTDGGVSWDGPIKTFADANVASVFPVDNDYVFISGRTLEAGDEIGRSIDGGTNWTYSNLKAGDGFSTDVWFFDTTSGVAVAGNDIYQTVSGGDVSWANKYTGGPNVNFFSFSFADSNNGWAVGQDTGASYIVKTTDGGSTWEAQTVGTQGILASASALDSDHCWAVGYNRNVLRTTDGGSNWSLVVDGLPTTTAEVFAGVHFLDEYNGWIAGVESLATYAPVIYKWVVDPDVSSVHQTDSPLLTSFPRGFSGNIDINGINLHADTLVTAGADVVVNSVSVVGDSAQDQGYSYSTLCVNITVGSNAAVGDRDLTLINADTGVATYSAFNITPPPPVISNIEFDDDNPFYPPSVNLTQVATRPVVSFDFDAPYGVSTEGFRIYVATSAASSVVTPYDVPSTAYSGSTTLGTVSWQLPFDLDPGRPVITVYGEDLNRAGASQTCEVYVAAPLQPGAPSEVIVYTYPQPWDPSVGPVDIMIYSNQYFDNVEFMFVDSAGVLTPLNHLNLSNTLTPGNNKVGSWDGVNQFGNRIPTGVHILGITSGSSAGKIIGKGKVAVFYF